MNTKQEPHPPGECPTCDARRSTAKNDVEALLREADAWCGAFTGGGSRFAADIMKDLAVALRAEQERAHRFRVEAQAAGIATVAAKAHLRAVLDFFAPNVTFPFIRDARAFLAEEEQVAVDDLSGPNEARYAIRCERKRANDAEEENARLRAELATADEAQALLRARLAEVERERDAWRDARGAASDRADRALAAQAKAESEAAQLRAGLQVARERLESAIEGVKWLVEENAKGRA